MKYLVFLNESKELDNLWLLIENDDHVNVSLGLAMAVNYKKEFKKRYNCIIAEYQEMWNWFEEYGIKHKKNIIDTVDIFANNKKITFIPESIRILQNLEYIELTNNRLIEIPNGLCDCANLTMIFIKYNKLTAIPNNISKLKNLKNLMLGNNEITILPDIFDKMENLKTISIINNKLSVIPSTFAKMDSDVIISLSNNPVTTRQNTITRKK